MKPKNIFAVFSGIILMICLFSPSLEAGDMAGLGHNYSARQGAGALLANPAFVNSDDDFFILELGGKLEVWNNALQSGYYYQHIDNEIKDDIFNKIEDGGLILAADGHQDLRLIIGNVGLYAGLREDVFVNIDSDLVELLLEGNELNRVYELEDFGGKAAVYADGGISASFSVGTLAGIFDFDEFILGFTGRGLAGAFGNVEGSGELEVTSEGDIKGYEDAYAEVEYAEMAAGGAIDIGIRAQTRGGLNIGAALLNIGKMEAIDAYYRKFEYDPDFDPDQDEMPFKEVKYEKIDELVYELPRHFKFGLHYPLGNRIDLYGDYTRIMYGDDIGTDNIVAGGMELRPLGIIPMRFGAQYSSHRDNLAFSTGLGLHLGPLQADVGVSDLKILSGEAQSAKVGVSARIAF